MSIEKTVQIIATEILHERMIPFIGAGLSPGPKWHQLLHRIASSLLISEPDQAKTDLTSLPYLVELQHEGARGGVTALIRELYGMNAYAGPTPYYDLLKELPVRTYLTTNFDPILENVLRAYAISKDSDVNQWNPQVRNVIKMHGSWDGPYVLTERDYLEYERNFKALSKLVFTLLMTHSILFMGFSFTDPNVRPLFSQVHQHLGMDRRPSFYVGFNISESRRKYLAGGFQMVVLDLLDLTCLSCRKTYRELRTDENADDLLEAAHMQFLKQLVERTRLSAFEKVAREQLLAREAQRFMDQNSERDRKGNGPGIQGTARSIIRIRATVGPFGVPDDGAASNIWGADLVPHLLRRRRQMEEIVKSHDVYAILTATSDFQRQRQYGDSACLARLESLRIAVEKFRNLIPVIEDRPTGLSTYVFGEDVIVQSVNTGSKGSPNNLRQLYDGAQVVTERRSVDAAIQHFDSSFAALTGISDLRLPIRDATMREKVRGKFVNRVDQLIDDLKKATPAA